jgi:hypothetical protein
LQIRCEHTIYRAASRWWQFSANSIINQSGVNKDAALLQKAAMRLISTVWFVLLCFGCFWVFSVFFGLFVWLVIYLFIFFGFCFILLHCIE